MQGSCILQAGRRVGAHEKWLAVLAGNAGSGRKASGTEFMLSLKIVSHTWAVCGRGRGRRVGNCENPLRPVFYRGVPKAEILKLGPAVV